MKFLADEGCDFAIVRALRADGFDVLSIRETYPGIPDPDVATIARESRRVLITEDKDFGELVFATGPPQGIVLLRVPHAARRWTVKVVVELARMRGDQLLGSFVVIQPGKVRSIYYDQSKESGCD